MIDQVINRDFVLGQAERVRAELAHASETEGLADDGPLQHARMELERSLKRERRVGPLEATADTAWVPRDMTLSILQTVMEERIRDSFAGMVREAGGDHPLVSQTVDVSGQGGDFTKHDPGWVRGTARAVAERLWRGRHEFVSSDAPPDEPLATNARVILLSDWGTGGPTAQTVAGLARHELECAGRREAHVIHLGDVYYAGEWWESEERFLKYWPVYRGEERHYRSWSLMGNHDMYAGGYGFYDHILTDARFYRQRIDGGTGISYFALSNKHWQILGIDTAWDDHLITHQGHAGYLQDPQGEWIFERVTTARQSGQRTMLLSHHQGYTTHGHHGDRSGLKGNLADKLAPTLTSGGIDAWLWGHEHRCQTFAPRADVAFSACVGNSAMPEAVGGAAPEPGEWEFDRGGSEWRWCGLTVLDFNEAQVTVRYIVEEIGEFERDQLPAVGPSPIGA